MTSPPTKTQLKTFSAAIDLLMQSFSKDPSHFLYFVVQAINEKEAAEFMGYSVRTLQSLRLTGGGPTYFHPTKRSVRYRRLECLLWLENGVVKNTSQYDGIATQFSELISTSPPCADNDNSKEP